MPGRLWRFVVTDLETRTLTILDRLAHDRKATYVLNDEAVWEGRVPADSSEVNIAHTDGDPFLAMKSRLLYCFRRESDELPFWNVRGAGTIEIVEDAGEDTPSSRFVAYDPWRLLKSRPLINASGLLPADGLTFRSQRGSVMAKTLLERTDVAHGSCRIDYGQTDFYEGTITTTDDVIDHHFEAGSSVGEGWIALTDGGTLDIVLTPIYDPVNRPGFLAELNIYERAGASRPAAVMAWDKPSRSLVSAGRLQDGTQMANKVLFYTGNGLPAALQTDAASVTKFGQHWLEKSISDQYVISAVQLLARAELRLRRNGKTTLTVDPAPERSPEPFTDYFLGDTVPIYASNRLRFALEAAGEDARRVYGIPIDIGDDGTENVDKLLIASPFEDS